MLQARVRTIGFAVLLFVILAYIVSQARPKVAAAGAIDTAERKVASDISFLEAPANGLPKHLSDLHGKVVVMDLWATWCGPCRMSIPDFVQMNKDLHGKPLAIIGVAMDSADTEAEVPASAKDLGINYPVALGSKSTGITPYQTNGIPTLYIIDKQGRVAFVMQGYSPTFSIEQQVKAILDEG